MLFVKNLTSDYRPLKLMGGVITVYKWVEVINSVVGMSIANSCIESVIHIINLYFEPDEPLST